MPGNTDSRAGVADKALQLIQQMKQNPDVMPPFNDEVMQECTAKMNELYELNNQCVTKLRLRGERATQEQENLMITRNAALLFIKRCCLAYVYARTERIKSYRWKLGGVLPASIKNNLCESEIEFFHEYCSSLAEFQAGVGENGVNLMLNAHPPKKLFVQVRVLENYGEFETSDGNLVMLRVNSIHSLPRQDCEMLIRQGILEIAN
uniref:DNA replication complex GINS protein PSF1 n=1 Tax=Heterorhabditis bacteriophora TaxID=37862 RepID=A0A1I7XLL5_HETBA